MLIAEDFVPCSSAVAPGKRSRRTRGAAAIVALLFLVEKLRLVGLAGWLSGAGAQFDAANFAADGFG